MKLYPIKLTFHVNPYVFGERLIEQRLGKRNLPAGKIAETWEVSGYKDKTGILTNGDLAGRRLERLAEAHHEPPHPQRCMTLSNLGASVLIQYDGGSETLERAESCIIPAALEDVRVLPTDQTEAADLIVCYVPDLKRNIIEPLRAAGHSDTEIGRLGEVGL